MKRYYVLMISLFLPLNLLPAARPTSEQISESGCEALEAIAHAVPRLFKTLVQVVVYATTYEKESLTDEYLKKLLEKELSQEVVHINKKRVASGQKALNEHEQKALKLCILPRVELAHTFMQRQELLISGLKKNKIPFKDAAAQLEELQRSPEFEPLKQLPKVWYATVELALPAVSGGVLDVRKLPKDIKKIAAPYTPEGDSWMASLFGLERATSIKESELSGFGIKIGNANLIAINHFWPNSGVLYRRLENGTYTRFKVLDGCLVNQFSKDDATIAASASNGHDQIVNDWFVYKLNAEKTDYAVVYAVPANRSRSKCFLNIDGTIVAAKRDNHVVLGTWNSPLNRYDEVDTGITGSLLALSLDASTFAVAPVEGRLEIYKKGKDGVYVRVDTSTMHRDYSQEDQVWLSGNGNVIGFNSGIDTTIKAWNNSTHVYDEVFNNNAVKLMDISADGSTCVVVGPRNFNRLYDSSPLYVYGRNEQGWYDKELYRTVVGNERCSLMGADGSMLAVTSLSRANRPILYARSSDGIYRLVKRFTANAWMSGDGLTGAEYNEPMLDIYTVPFRTADFNLEQINLLRDLWLLLPESTKNQGIRLTSEQNVVWESLKPKVRSLLMSFTGITIASKENAVTASLNAKKKENFVEILGSLIDSYSSSFAQKIRFDVSGKLKGKISSFIEGLRMLIAEQDRKTYSQFIQDIQAYVQGTLAQQITHKSFGMFDRQAKLDWQSFINELKQLFYADKMNAMLQGIAQEGGKL